MPTLHRNRRDRKRRAGLASIEIIVMLPVFIVMLLGVVYLHEQALARQSALVAARGCAFHYASLGCTDAAKRAPACQGLDVGRAASLEGYEASRFDEVADWPLLGAGLRALFGVGAVSRASREHAPLSGGAKVAVTESFYLVCNTESVSWKGRMEQLVCAAASKLGTDALCK